MHFLVVIVFIAIAFAGDNEAMTAVWRTDSSAITTEDIRFWSGDIPLDGTVLSPTEPGRKPALAMVHGAGPGSRDSLRPEAEAFARAGIVTLIYDKRTVGYSASGVGSRSFDLLAEDALAAVRVLQARPDVDAAMVGLWGLSEGAWVAPMAAARSEDVAFLALVGASGLSPADQVSWSLETRLRHNGVAGSMRDVATRTGVRFLAEADLLAEADHDPAAVLANVRQPVLAMWGALDQVAAPADSGRIVQDALARGGNRHYVIRYFSGADHDMRISPDGFAARSARDPLAAGYVETLADWVGRVASGDPPGPAADPPPSQAVVTQSHPSPAGRLPSATVAGMTLPVIVAFAAYPMAALTRWMCRRASSAPARVGPAGWLAGVGLATVFGCVGYVSYVVATQAVAVVPAVAGRPWAWVALHGLALTTVVLALWTAMTWWTRRRAIAGVERLRLGFLLIIGGLAFVPWAFSWGLLVP